MNPLDWFAGVATLDRAHLRVRWATCPIPAIEARVPTGGRVLELACGHGLLAAYLAATSPGRDVEGIDVDARKIEVASRAAGRARAAGARLAFTVADMRHVPPGPWEAIVIADALYLLDADAQHDVIRRAAGALAPGGVLVLKEMAGRPRWKARWNRLQETLAVRVLRITEGRSVGVTPPDRLAGAMAAAGLRVVESVALDPGYVHPHHLLVGRRPGGDG